MGFTVAILGYSFIATVLTNLSPFLSENEQLQNIVLLFVVGLVLFIGGMWVAHKSKNIYLTMTRAKPIVQRKKMWQIQWIKFKVFNNFASYLIVYSALIIAPAVLLIFSKYSNQFGKILIAMVGLSGITELIGTLAYAYRKFKPKRGFRKIAYLFIVFHHFRCIDFVTRICLA